jgi:hypothetical protein
MSFSRIFMTEQIIESPWKISEAPHGFFTKNKPHVFKGKKEQ